MISQTKISMKKYRKYSSIGVIVFLMVVLVSMQLKAATPIDDKERKPITFGSVAQEPEPKFMLGASIGSPTGASLLGSLYFDKFGVRFSSGVGRFGWQGGQVDLTYLVSRYGRLRHDVSLTVGMFRFDNSDTTSVVEVDKEFYVGAAYTVLYRGFHFQLGFAYGAGDYTHTVALFEVGYLFKIM